MLVARTRPYPRIAWLSGLLAVVLLCLSGGVQAEQSTHLTLDASQSRYDIGGQLWWLEDPNQYLTVEDFISRANRFNWQPGVGSTPNFGYSHSAYWVRFSVDNSLDSVQWLMEVAYPMLDDVQVFYVKQGHLLQQFNTGDEQVFSSRPMFHRMFVFPLPATEEAPLEVYIRVATSGTLEIPVVLYQSEAFWEKEQVTLLLHGIYVGLIMVMVFYNLFIYFAVRDPSYLYYVCYAFFVVAFQFSLDGMAYQFLWPSSPSWHAISFIFCTAFSSIFVCLFSISFLNLQQRAPFFYYALLTIAIVQLVCAAFTPFGTYALMIRIVVGMIFPIALLAMMAGVVLLTKKVAVARYYLLGWSVFLGGAIALAASKFGFLPVNMLTDHSMQIGSALEVVIFSLALADRINLEKAEKLAAKQEAIENLERFKTLYDNALEGIFQCTLEGHFVSVNPSLVKTLGFDSEEEFFTHPGHESTAMIVDPAVFHEFRRIVLERGKILNFETKGKKRDGRPFWFSISAKLTESKLHSEPLIEGFVVDITERKHSEDQLQFLSRHDPLTGLVNRREFEHRLDMVLNEARREGAKHSLLFMDMDQFKLVNDTCGHIAGDEMLRQVTLLIQQQLRSGDTLARMGGDEFGVLLEHCSGANALTVANKIRTNIQDFRFVWDDKVFAPGVSIGLVTVDQEVDSVNDLLSLADAACYAAKDAGRNRVHEYDPADLDMASQRNQMQWVSRINLALENDDFVLYAQPISSIGSAETDYKHFEILIRMKANGGLIEPIEFLPAAERYNLMPALDRWVVRNLFQWMAQHPEKVAHWETISVNLSGLTLGDNDFANFLREQFSHFNIPYRKICFEITETVAVINLANTLHFMEEFKSFGCCFSLDDFGSGFSSYGYLKSLPVDYLKIDGSFVKDIETDKIDFAMVESINRIGHVMGKKTIAEFVENDRILAMLESLGVDFAQGYGISRPMPLADL